MAGAAAPPEIELIIKDSRGGGGGGGRPPDGGDGGDDGDRDKRRRKGSPSPRRFSTGIAIGMVSILMRIVSAKASLCAVAYRDRRQDRKSTRLNSSHVSISY